ncbi:3' terminal RNA ribose 2'-O-methyltransferase Hen1 [Terrabacter sp. MAHUQ-38]|uniref:3' terminal RNA ribose 2'-O-methyltransferase Hen1 n=1 Tax=unclassified Terrabacter TaxID=2630222 RepID=UPI00165D76A9|nr:3' terminal RNA ribose 2'-O-methyltransferase Hen1 [Terrabacter sp. MAHUQ-38]
MLLTITTNATESATGRVPASDLGYLLHKHPDRVQAFDLPVGTAHVFYPEVSEDRCTAALLLEVDPIGLVRGKRFGGDAFALAQYVNDRPYAASSMLAVALGKVWGTALKGRCAARPDLEGVPLPLRIAVPAVPCSGGVDLGGRLFAPLGWDVTARTVALDPQVPAWGDSRYVDLVLEGTMPLADALSHLYVLLPVLDGAKHYWVSTDEVDKLVRNSGAWLASHPERDLVTRRYLAHQRSFVVDATARLDALDDTASSAFTDASELDATADGSEPPTPLVRLRAAAVLSALRDVGAHRVVDLGCGEGALLRELLTDPSFTEVVGLDVAAGVLERAERRLALERMPDSVRARLTLRQSSATYRDRALEGYDAVVLMEVVEHLDLDRLPALERSVFGHARPASVVVTTPNAEYNVRYERLPGGAMRHPDHRFEWTRAEFGVWAAHVAERYGYAVELRPVGEADPLLGPPTQLALFRRDAVSVRAGNDTSSVSGGAA